MLENFGSLRAGAIGLSLLYCGCSVCSDPLGEEGHNDPAKQTQEIEKKRDDLAENLRQTASKLKQWPNVMTEVMNALLSAASEMKADKHRIKTLEECLIRGGKECQEQNKQIQELEQKIKELERIIQEQNEMIECYKKRFGGDLDDKKS